VRHITVFYKSVEDESKRVAKGGEENGYHSGPQMLVPVGTGCKYAIGDVDMYN